MLSKTKCNPSVQFIFFRIRVYPQKSYCNSRMIELLTKTLTDEKTIIILERFLFQLNTTFGSQMPNHIPVEIPNDSRYLLGLLRTPATKNVLVLSVALCLSHFEA